MEGKTYFLLRQAKNQMLVMTTKHFIYHFTIMIIIITLVARDKNPLGSEFEKSTRRIGKQCLALVNVQSLLPY